MNNRVFLQIADSSASQAPDIAVSLRQLKHVKLNRNYTDSLKPLLDTALSILILSISLPVTLSLIVLLLFTQGRHPFYRQKRVGKHGITFMMYKFRTMRHGADRELQKILCMNEREGPVFKMRNDPRVTAVGRLLRTLSLDELPQFLNVLKGEMSIVGPRPPIYSEVLLYDRHSKKRLLTVPGITGPWQISGRANVGFRDMVRLDIKYMRRASFFLDLWIILRTLPSLLGCKGAY